MAAVFALMLSSCVSLLDLEQYAGAVSALCTEFNNCFAAKYPSCTGTGSLRLTQANPEMRASWLGDFVDNKCFGICNDTWACLDSKPICGAIGESCAVDEECCSFSSAASTCKGGTCCMQDGQPCVNADECCTGRCVEGSCGGVVCGSIDDGCERDDDCCTGLRCSRESGLCFKCGEPGFSCVDDADCCGFCVNNVCTECGQDGEPCDTAAECCNQFCVVVPSTDGDVQVCSGGDCRPDGFSCGGDDEVCCSKYCDPVTDSCGQCAFDGQPCFEVEDCCNLNCSVTGICGEGCLGAEAPCALDAECCSHRCSPWALQSGMAGDAVCCVVPDDSNRCSNVCVPRDGLPMGSDCPLDNTLPVDPQIADSCIEMVCLDDPHCCCLEWDATCVQKLEQVCGIDCSVVVINN